MDESRLRRLSSLAQQGGTTRAKIVIEFWPYRGKTIIQVRQPLDEYVSEVWVVEQGLIFERGQVLFEQVGEFSYLNMRRVHSLSVQITSRHELVAEHARPAKRKSDLQVGPRRGNPTVVTAAAAASSGGSEGGAASAVRQDEASQSGCLVLLAFAVLMGVLFTVAIVGIFAGL